MSLINHEELKKQQASGDIPFLPPLNTTFKKNI